MTLVDFSNDDARICVIGRTDFDSGIGAFSHAACELFSRHAPTCILPTDGASGREHAELPSGRLVPVCRDLSAPEIFFFADILFNGAHDNNLARMPQRGIHFAHLCFDSDHLPPEWVWRLNHHFEGAFVPSTQQQEVAIRSGVRTPVSVLPIALPIEGLLARPFRGSTDTVRFGTISAYHERKELERLVVAFRRVFQGRRDVELVIHSNLVNRSVLEQVRTAASGAHAPKVTLSSAAMSPDSRDDLLESFDVFVNCSRGEGYSIGAREALALGKALVLSEIGAHGDLIGLPGVHRIPAEVPTVARYPEIDNRVFGLQARVRQADLESMLVAAHEFVTGDDYRSTARARRLRAADFSFARLSLEYASVVDPRAESTRLGSASRRSPTTWHAPESIACVRALGRTSLWSSPRSRLVVPCYDAGFFSVFNTFLSHLVWGLQNDRCHAVLPDWDQARLTVRIGSAQRESFCYGKPEDENIWTKLYAPLFDVSVSELNDGDSLYRGASVPETLYNEQREPLLTYSHAYDLYRSPTFPNFRRQYHEAYRRFIAPLVEVQQPVDDLLQERVGSRFLIAAHVKHPSHVIEQPDGLMASHAAYFDEIRRSLVSHGIAEGSDDWRIFLGTDQDRVTNAFEDAFPDRVVYFPGVRRTTVEEDARYDALRLGAQSAPGHQVQHLVAAAPENWSVEMAREIIRDAVAMATADVLFHVVSNVATAISYMNPRLEMHFVDVPPH